MSAFPATRLSVIERLRNTEDDQRRLAFGDLVDGYWKPVYKHLRVRWRLSQDEAEDLTQDFFAEAFEGGWLERFDPDKARFRTFVRLCIDRLVMHTRQAARREKRGGGAELLSIDFAGAEHELVGQMSTAPEAEAFFDREFVRALFDRAVRALRGDYLARGRDRHWTVFEKYDLVEQPAGYAALAAELGLTQGQVTGYLAQARRDFRAHVIGELRGLCATADELRRESRELLGVEIE